MRYAQIINNDVVNGEDVCVSLWMQGCPYHCTGCHNPETWDFNGGNEIDRDKLISIIIDRIQANGIRRNFSILGGEPLCDENVDDTMEILAAVRKTYPDIKTFVWTGATIEELQQMYPNKDISKDIDVLIDGRFIQAERDVSLALRGSLNQRILRKKKN